MGTYTTNYNLFMPSVGEQGWGELVNNNFSTIDTTMSGLNTRMGTAETNVASLINRMGTAETTIASNKSRIGTLETETGAMKEKLDKIDITEENVTILDTVQADEFVGNVGNFSTIFVKGTTSNTGFKVGEYYSVIENPSAYINKVYYGSTYNFIESYEVPSPLYRNLYSLYNINSLTGNLNLKIDIKFSVSDESTARFNVKIYKNDELQNTIVGLTTSYKTTNVTVNSGDIIKITYTLNNNGMATMDGTMSANIQLNGLVYLL